MKLRKYKADPKDPAPHKSLHVECPDCRGSCCDDYYLLTKEELEQVFAEGWRLNFLEMDYKCPQDYARRFPKWLAEQEKEDEDLQSKS